MIRRILIFIVEVLSILTSAFLIWQIWGYYKGYQILSEQAASIRSEYSKKLAEYNDLNASVQFEGIESVFDKLNKTPSCSIESITIEEGEESVIYDYDFKEALLNTTSSSAKLKLRSFSMDYTLEYLRTLDIKVTQVDIDDNLIFITIPIFEGK